MMSHHVGIVLVFLFVISNLSDAQPLSGLGESCSSNRCPDNLKCTQASTGKRCLKVIPLDGNCGAANTTCFYGSRCVYDEVTGDRTCVEETAHSWPCGLPSEKVGAAAVCEGGKNLVCDFEETTNISLEKQCIRIITPGDRCEIQDRCTEGHGCVNGTCQKVPAVGIGEKCQQLVNSEYFNTVAVCKSDKFKLVCDNAPGQYNRKLCLKLGTKGDYCDNFWRHCGYGLMCLEDPKMKHRVCSGPPTAGFGEECGTRNDEYGGFATCRRGLRCHPVLSEYRKARCWKANLPGASCAGKLQHCVEGYECGSDKTCVKETESDIGGPCSDYYQVEEVNKKCKPGLRCRYPIMDGSKRCATQVAPGDVCGIFKRCPLNHECIKGVNEAWRCLPVADLGEDCSTKVCKCNGDAYGEDECSDRLLCLKTANGVRCAHRNPA